MPTPVFLTIDTELRWGDHAAGLGIDDIYARSIEPAGVGIGYQLDQFRRYGLKATFFVDPMPAILFGLDPIRRIVDTVLNAGQEVQLHLHPNWAGAKLGDKGAAYIGFEMMRFPRYAQRDLIEGAVELLTAAGAPPPVAFRAGCFGANDDTLDALGECGFEYDSSHNGAAAPWPSEIALPATQVAPVRRGGVIEVPVSLVEDRAGQFRPFQICALSIGEIRAALDHAIRKKHVATTIVSHSFELANRNGCRANGIHVRRFDSMCRMLGEAKEALPTVHFRDRPALALGFNDVPLAPSALRTTWRQAEQLWSNMVEERAA